MNTADLIYQEAQTLPESLAGEVLDFIGFLKTRHSDMVKKETDELAELEEFFAPYLRDLSDFHFDREEANER
ncbi:DUF2281 domain-containing protein [Methylomagnum sp.]